MNNNVSEALCPHIITHIDPVIESLLREKLNLDFSSINTMTVEGFQQFGQIGIQAQWLLDNLDKIEKISGLIIDSNSAWNSAVARLTKKGFTAIEGFDKNAVDAAISLKRRESKILEGKDRLTNADSLHSQLRIDNNEKDKIKIGIKLAQSLAELEQARIDAQSEPAIQAAMAAWKETLGVAAKQAKLALHYGNDAPTHPRWGGASVGHLPSASQPQFAGYQQQRQLSGSAQDSISFSGNWSGNIAGKTKQIVSNTKQFASNVGNGFQKIRKFFGGK